MMKKFRELSEAIKDKFDIGEYDQEGDMAKSDLRSIIANSKRVHDMLKDDDNLPEWVQSKITKAEDYMSTVANYMEAEMNEAVKMPKQTRAEKEYRKITGKTVDQRMSELDKVQKDLAKQREDYIKQGIIKAEEVELDEASTAERKERNAAINNMHKGFYDKASKSKLKKVSKIGSDTYFIKSRSIYDPHESHFKTASGKYGSTMHSSEGGVPSHQEIHKDIKDHNPHLSKDEVKSAANVIHAHMSKHRLGEEVELDEALRHEIAGQVGRFIGNKIDPVHGDIMHAHGKEAYRQAAYHIRKTISDVKDAVSSLHDRLHKQLRTGGLATEEVEQIEEAQVHKVVKQKDGTHDVHVKTEYGEIKHIGTIHAPDKEGVRVAKHKDGTKVAMSKNVDELAKRLSGYHGKTMHEEVEIDEARYPGFRPGLGLGKSGAPSQRDNYKDFNDGRPFGFTPIKDKDEPKSGMSDKLRQAKIKNPAMKSMTKEEVEHLEEKNVPTSPEKWAQAKAQAKAKFDVYPSAYANGWAAKKYKEMGGGWKSVSEETELEEGYFKNQEIERQETERLAKRNEPPFTPDKPKKRSVVVGKKPEGYSIARQLARQAMQKYTTPVKEENEMSKKAKIVKGIMKKDKFEADPVISKTVDDKQS